MKMTNGMKSSEFWLTLMGNVAAVLLTVSGVVDPKVAGIMVVVSNGLYAISRGFAKKV